MELALDCTYRWINNSTEAISCSSDLTHDYVVLQVVLGIGLTFILLKGLRMAWKRLEAWVDEE